MEQTIVERPVSQGQCVRQLHMQHYGTLNNSGVQLEKDSSERWFSSRWTGQRETITSGSSRLNRFRQDKVPVPVCRDNLRGSCARGASCKYEHSETDRHDKSRFNQKDQEKLSAAPNSVNSQLYRATESCDSRTRFSSRGHGSRSPCRIYQSGGSYLHQHHERMRYDRPTYDSSLDQKEVVSAVRDANLVERNRDKILTVSRESVEVNKENSVTTKPFSRDYRSRSPCRNFLRGKCTYGASCKRLHPIAISRHDLDTQLHQKGAPIPSHPGFGEGSRDVKLRTSQVHGEMNLHNGLRTGFFSRENRSRSPCRDFLNGKCYRGPSCVRFHPGTVHDRTRSNYWSAQQHDGVSATSRTSSFSNGSIANSLRISRNPGDRMNSGVQPCQDMHFVYEQNNAWSTKDDVRFNGNRVNEDMRLNGNRVNEDVASRSWSYGGERSRSASDFGGNNLGREVCIQFTKGRCNRGENCRHLHGFHYFARSNWKKPNAEAVVTSRESCGAIQHGDAMMAQEHNGVQNYKMPFGETKHTENSLVSSDGGFDKEITGHSACDVVGQKTYYKNGEAPAMDGRECEISGENIAIVRRSAEGHRDVSLWSPPFKRQRRFDSQVDSCRDRGYNGGQFQSPDRRCHKYDMHIHHVNSLQPSKSEATSVNPSSHVDNESKLLARQGDVEVASQGLQLDQCPNGNHGSHITAASNNCEAEFTRCVLPSSHKDQNGIKLEKDNGAVDSSEGAAAIGREVLESDLKSSCGEDHISAVAVDLTNSGKEGNVEMIVDVGQESNYNAAELLPTTMKICYRKKSRKRRPRSVSSEDTMKEEVNTLNQMTTSPLAEASSSNPNILSSVSGFIVDRKTSASENEGLENLLLQEHPVKKNKYKCNKICSQSASCEETMKTEVTTNLKQGISSSSLVETSSGKKKAKKCKKKPSKKETMKQEGVPSSLLETSSDLNILSASCIPVYQKSIASEDEEQERALMGLRDRFSNHRALKKTKKEVTSASKKPLPTCFLVETSSSKPYILSTSGISADVEMRSSQNNDLEDVLVNDCPVNQRDNGSMTNETVDNMESTLGTTEDGTLLVHNAHGHSLQSLPKTILSNSRRKLLVLDLNGILADIVPHYPRRVKPDITVSAKGVFKRPFCDDFLHFCFERFNVGVWSSRVRKNVNSVVNFLMKDNKKRLLFCWDQTHCTATGYQTLENKCKPLLLKELRYLWDNEDGCLPWDKGFYNETNTVLLDDSPYKALRNPPYTGIFPYPYTYKNIHDKSLGRRGDLRIYLERLAEAEDVQKFIQENDFGQKNISDSNSSWDFYSKVACTCGIHHE